MPRFRKKPVEVDAVLWTGQNAQAIGEFMGQPVTFGYFGGINIHTLEGVMTAPVGWFIVRGGEGEYYPVEPGIFAKTYEQVELF